MIILHQLSEPNAVVNGLLARTNGSVRSPLMRFDPTQPATPATRPPPGTLRIIGIVVVSGGRALDLALVESDGDTICRRIELERIPIGPDSTDAAIGAAVLAFMGDRALQPFAIDILALAAGTSASRAAALQLHLDVRTVIVNHSRQWPRLPAAERTALAAVPLYQAEIASGYAGGCAIAAG